MHRAPYYQQRCYSRAQRPGSALDGLSPTLSGTPPSNVRQSLLRWPAPCCYTTHERALALLSCSHRSAHDEATGAPSECAGAKRGGPRQDAPLPQRLDCAALSTKRGTRSGRKGMTMRDAMLRLKAAPPHGASAEQRWIDDGGRACSEPQQWNAAFVARPVAVTPPSTRSPRYRPKRVPSNIPGCQRGT
jgi:hypothetical protein